MPRHSWLSTCASLAALTLATRITAADERTPTTDERARAQQLFDSAIADVGAGRYDAACPKFAASHEIDPKTSTLMNLGACYESVGRYASAWAAFREAEGLARKGRRADFEARARESADALVPKLVRLTVVVPNASRVPGLVVSRDGGKLPPPEWGVGIPVDDGEHEVVAEAPGQEPWRQRVVVQGQNRSVEVGTLAVAPPSRSSRSSRSSTVPGSIQHSWWTPQRTIGAAAAGVGGVGIVTGVILGFVAKSNYDSAESRCADNGCPGDAIRSGERARSFANGATVVILSGAVVTAVGGALIALAPSRPTAPRAMLGVGPGSIGVAGVW